MSDLPPSRLIAAFVQEDHVWVDADVSVPWWSYAKTVLASAALALVAKGQMQLDEPVRGRPFTLRHLLQHRAGLGCYGALPAYHAAVGAGEHPWPVDEMLRRVEANTLANAPGLGWTYSNVGYLLVRKLIEAEVGAPLGPALERLVFEPLGITGVTVACEPADLDVTAWGNACGYDPGWVYHGLLVGPPKAAVLFLDRLLDGDLLPLDLLAELQAGYPIGDAALPGRPWHTARYGLGLMMGKGTPPGEYVGHTGGGPGSTAAVYRTIGETAGRQRTGAVFAAIDEPGMVEFRAMALATSGPVRKVR